MVHYYVMIDFEHYDLKLTKLHKNISLLVLRFNQKKKKKDGGVYLHIFKKSVGISLDFIN